MAFDYPSENEIVDRRKGLPAATAKLLNPTGYKRHLQPGNGHPRSHTSGSPPFGQSLAAETSGTLDLTGLRH